MMQLARDICMTWFVHATLHHVSLMVLNVWIIIPSPPYFSSNLPPPSAPTTPILLGWKTKRTAPVPYLLWKRKRLVGEGGGVNLMEKLLKLFPILCSRRSGKWNLIWIRFRQPTKSKRSSPDGMDRVNGGKVNEI